jgi:hypothetical protein
LLAGVFWIRARADNRTPVRSKKIGNPEEVWAPRSGSFTK